MSYLAGKLGVDGPEYVSATPKDPHSAYFCTVATRLGRTKLIRLPNACASCRAPGIAAMMEATLKAAVLVGMHNM